MNTLQTFSAIMLATSSLCRHFALLGQSLLVWCYPICLSLLRLPVSLSTSVSCTESPVFSCSCLMLAGHMFRSLMHLAQILYRVFRISAQIDPIFPALLLKRPSFLLSLILIYFSNFVDCGCVDSLLEFLFSRHIWFSCISLPALGCPLL